MLFLVVLSVLANIFLRAEERKLNVGPFPNELCVNARFQNSPVEIMSPIFVLIGNENVMARKKENCEAN
jgi:hypothetical protein